MLKHLMHHRVEKMLKDSAVAVTIKCDTEKNPALPAHMILNIGTPAVGFLPDMRLVLDYDGFECECKIRFLGPELRQLRVLWSSVVSVAPIPRPDPGGGKVTIRRAA